MKSFGSFGAASPLAAAYYDNLFFGPEARRYFESAEAPLKLLTDNLGDLTPVLAVQAFATRAYVRAQLLLWLDHINSGIVKRQDWEFAALLAENAKHFLLLNHGVMDEAEVLDTDMRIEFVLGRGALALNSKLAPTHFFLVIGMYDIAQQRNYNEVISRRLSDWQTSVYALLDFTEGRSRESAFVLVKHCQVGAYKIFPLVRYPIPEGGFAFKTNVAPFDDWAVGIERLCVDTAVVDMVITERMLHLRLLHTGGTLNIQRDILRYHDNNLQTQLIAPEGGVFEPTVSEEYFRLASLQFRSSRFRSGRLQWLYLRQVVEFYWEEPAWSWKYNRFSMSFPSADVWRTIYEALFKEVLAYCEGHGVRHIVVSPDGSLIGVPHHLLTDVDGVRLGDKVAVSYTPNLTGILPTFDAREFDARFTRSEVSCIVIEDPTRTVSLASWECAAVAHVLPCANVIRADEATVSRVINACSEVGIFHFTGHAKFDTTNPDNSYLVLRGGACFGLQDLGNLRFHPGGLAFLSACETGRRSQAGNRATSRGIVSTLMEAGAATVICTLWPVHSVAAALCSFWFYQAWIVQGKGRLESLRWATRNLQECTQDECKHILGRRAYLPGAQPFRDEYYWGAFVLYGAW